MINNAVHFNKTDGPSRPMVGDGISDHPLELPRSWVRTSLLFEYLSESKLSQSNPFVNINGENVSEVDFHVNASFDYINETGIWDDGETIDEKWWFKNSGNTTETIFHLQDQVKIWLHRCW